MAEINLSAEDFQRLNELGFALETRTEEGEPRLALRDLLDPKMQPLSVDFTSGTVIHRLKHGLSKNQPLSRALGLRGAGDEVSKVFDATAGLGVDAFFVAALGCDVRAVERSPVVYALLVDGFRRLERLIDNENFADEMFTEKAIESLRIVRSHLRFERGDAGEILRTLSDSERPDIVYLDPMYPEQGRSRSALPKKGMQIFHRLIGDDRDAAEIFELGFKRARKRVVVKRPLYAEPLRANPTHVFEGKTARYDMYLSLNVSS